MGIFNTIKNAIINLCNRIAVANIVSPRMALICFIRAIESSNTDMNNEINGRECAKLYLSSLKNIVFRTDMTDDEITEAVNRIMNLK